MACWQSNFLAGRGPIGCARFISVNAKLHPHRPAPESVHGLELGIAALDSGALALGLRDCATIRRASFDKLRTNG
ncbi:MAG TPA: hypothetical protein VLK23_19680 [Thermodesulfobacteriota bacterium]|nr:hypothetical protein [Thermodesulfobacteriota bacterium]